MEAISEVMSFIYNNILSISMMVLMIAAGIFLTVRTRFFQFRRFGYHSRVILHAFAVVAYALACVCSPLLTPVIARWSHGRGLCRKVHPQAGLVCLVGYQVRWEPSKLRAVRPTLAAFPGYRRGLEGPPLATRDRRGILVIQWTFGPL